MKSPLAGYEPVENVVMMENHNEAYLAWRGAGLKNKILVHLDAHIDFAWMRDKDPLKILEAEGTDELERILKDRSSWNLSAKAPDELVNIGNYVYPAMKDNIVKEFFWVLPDPIWRSPKERRAVKRNLKEILNSGHAQQRQISETKEGNITAKIYGRNIIVCDLAGLPELSEPVLLDIDVDFLTTESISGYNLYRDIKRVKPWVWPGDLINRLKQKKMITDFITIAYSVEGGFTPLKYKYLGDDLKALFRNPSSDEAFNKLMLHKKEGAIQASLGRDDKAIEEFQEALKLMPGDAPGHYDLAFLFYDKGLYDKAANAYHQAIALDPAYKTEYNNYGLLYEERKLWGRAESEYRKILRLDSNDANACRGLGNIYVARHRWEEAILNYQKSIGLNGKNHKPHYNLGYVYARMGKYDAAITEFEESLRIKADDARASRWLGYLYTKKRRLNDAIQAYKKSLNLGLYSAATHFKLCRLYFIQRKIYKAREEFGMGARLFPKATLFYFYGLIRQFWQRYFIGAIINVKTG